MDIELDLGVGEGDVEPDTRVIPLCQIRDNNSNSDITDDMGFGLNLVLEKKIQMVIFLLKLVLSQLTMEKIHNIVYLFKMKVK